MWRPRFHYTDPDSWLNDPNGLVYADGVWHMYYQAAPHQPDGGPKYWGHALSSDLVHWKFIDYPLEPDITGEMWSGTAIIDQENRSKLFDNISHTGIIAAYSTDKQSIGLAYSKDGGISFIKFNDKEPIIPNPNVKDFRDPCIFFYPVDNKWKMVIAGGKFSVYESEDLHHWELLSQNEIYTECPCFFKIRCEDNNEDKWILTCSSRFYIVGNFDGKKFLPETEKIIMNNGLDSYAGLVFNNAPKDRVIMINWMQNVDGNYMVKEGMWSQGMTLPVELKLYKDDVLGYRLAQNPVQELIILRNKKLLEIKDIQTKNNDVLKDISSNTFEMYLDIDINKSKDFQLILASDNKGEDEVSISYNIYKNALTLDRSKNKYGFENMTKINGRYVINVEPSSIKNNHLKLHLYFDMSCLEIYLNDGYSYIPFKCNPHSSSKAMHLKGDIYIKELNIFELNSIWE